MLAPRACFNPQNDDPLCIAVLVENYMPFNCCLGVCTAVSGCISVFTVGEWLSDGKTMV